MWNVTNNLKAMKAIKARFKKWRQHWLEDLKNPWFVTLVLVWAIELWIVQEATLHPVLWKENVTVFKDQIFRFIFDLLMAYGLGSLFGATWLALFAAAGVIFYATVISFHLVYHRALSALTVLYQSSEGSTVIGAAIAELGWIFPVLIAVGLGKIVLVFLGHRYGRASFRKRISVTAGVVVIYLLFAFSVDYSHRNMRAIATYQTVDGLAYLFGYVPTWIAEVAYVDYEVVLERATDRLNEKSDRIGAIDPDVNLEGNIVILQVESLDFDLIDFEIDGREVIPNINAMAAEGMLYRALAMKWTGSCDADYTMLMEALPSVDFPSYRIEDLPFETSIVSQANERGYDTSFFHGVDGSFFQRRDGYERMGFDDLAFREEFIERHRLEDPEWTLPDGMLFDASIARINEQETPFLSMIITGTSHTPFWFETPGYERVFFPELASNIQNYFDSIAYVDREIGEYVQALPPNTTVLIYGDHSSGIDTPSVEYERTLVDDFGRVPAIIFNTSKPLFDEQISRLSEANLEDDLTLLDFATYAHRITGLTVER